ncbi:site-specific integrase [Bacillus altitudinis]|nr:site-specific integrase [Bacillus altitudinis]
MIKELENGKWLVDVSLGTDPITGERIRPRREVTTKKEAEELEAEIKSKYKQNHWVRKEKIEFHDLLQLFYEHSEAAHKGTYPENMTYSINKHILPYFQKSILQNIRKKDILNFRKYLQSKTDKEKKLSNKTINNIMTILNQIFNVGVLEEILTTNPCDNIKRLPKEHKKMKFWTPQEFREFLKLIPKDQLLFKTFYTTAYLTGMRCGEMLGLKWIDIDRYKKEIDVNKASTFINGEHVLIEPKTKTSIRRISINSKLLSLLDQWRHEQEKLFNDLGVFHSDQTLIFQYKDTPPRKDIFSRKIKYFCSNDENLKVIRLHDLRHSHVALLIDQGEEYHTIKERLGHASIRTTIDVYGHLFPNKQKAMAEKLDDII